MLFENSTVTLTFIRMSEDLRLSILRVLPNTIALLVVTILFLMKRITPQQIELQTANNKRLAFVLVFCFLVYMFALEALSSSAGLLEISAWHHSLPSTVIRLSGAIIITPIVEEILFRGFVLNVLRIRLNLHAAAVLQALFFVLSHNTTFSLDNSALFYAVIGFLDALIYAYVRVYTKSLYPSIVMHACGNSLAMAERLLLA